MFFIMQISAAKLRINLLWEGNIFHATVMAISHNLILKVSQVEASYLGLLCADQELKIKTTIYYKSSVFPKFETSSNKNDTELMK